MNNLNEEDVDAGTGSSRRGNRAGMPDDDTGKISGGTMTSTGIDEPAQVLKTKCKSPESRNCPGF
jgi:hypothetical protein